MTGSSDDGIKEQVGAFFELERESMQKPILVTREMWLQFLRETRPHAYLLQVAAMNAANMVPRGLYLGETRR